MCGCYYIDGEGLQHVRSLVDEVTSDVGVSSWNRDIHPMDYAPVLTVMSQDKICLGRKRWGYPAIKNGGVIFNARAETVRERKLFSRGIEQHRAVVPAVHFYEWNSRREKNVFSGSDGELLYLAGFYDMMCNEDRFVILTTSANESMRSVHDRMPLILEPEQIRSWLQDPDSTDEILRQTPGRLNRYTEYEQLTLTF